ncbi:MAG: hypothetical protein M3394_05440 [Actinomycetota bacterium]|nr:hypothetical protein [Actinomycetota bacterium]
MALAIASLGMSSARVDAADADVGVCTLRIDVSASPFDVPLLPAERTWSLNGDGQCNTTAGLELSTLVGGSLREVVADVPTVGCATAVLTGNFTLNITEGGYSQIVFETVGVVAGSVVELTGVRLTDAAGTGVFVQQVEDTAQCATDQSISEATWCGVFAFTLATVAI